VIDVYVYTRDYMRGLVTLGPDGELPPVWDESLLQDPWRCEQ
jgi:hypothetical protein